jgi:hypothetical protein
MKIWMMVGLFGLLISQSTYAQGVEGSFFVVNEQPMDKADSSSVMQISDSQKIAFIIDTVHRLNPSKQAMQNNELAGDGVSSGYIEALIHSEGPDAIRKYHSSVRMMMKENVEWTKSDSMLLNISEIRMLSRHMNWKAMRSHLQALDRYSTDNFPIWTKMRVESWLVQAETMLYIRPDDEDKKRDIEGLIAKVRLAQKSDDDLAYDYTISDRLIDIEEGRIPDMSLVSIAGPQSDSEKIEQTQLETKKEEEKKGFFGSFAKKLKFW